ncbi:hypothetical protein ACF05F_32960 [Rhodococcus erythropolis]
MAADVRFTVLGPVQAWRSEVGTDLGAPKQGAVVAVLFLQEQGQVTVGELVEALWGAHPIASTVRDARTRRPRTTLPPDARLALPGRGMPSRQPSLGPTGHPGLDPPVPPTPRSVLGSPPVNAH